MTWHTDVAMLRSYHEGALGAAHEASVEAHLTSCAACRAALSELVDRRRLDRGWSAIVDQLDAPQASVVERVLERLGISEHRARLVLTTPALRSPSALAIVVLLLTVSALNLMHPTDADLYVFLVVAPLLPIAGVAMAFGFVSDRVRELVSSTPTTAFELLLVRTLSVVTATTVLSTIAAVPLPHGWQAAAWLLPSLGLTAAVLALATWMPVRHASAAVGVLWLAAAAVSWRHNRLDDDVLSRFAALRPAGQVAFAALAIGGALVCAVRRDAIDLRASL